MLSTYGGSALTHSHTGTVAQLVYEPAERPHFAQCIGELHCILAEDSSRDVAFEWAREDMAYFDLASTRLALGWHDDSLIVSAGPLADAADDGDEGYITLCSQIVEQLHQSQPAAAILWHRVERPMTCALFDQMRHDLPAIPRMNAEPRTEHDEALPTLVLTDRVDAGTGAASTIHPLPLRGKPAQNAARQRVARARARMKALTSPQIQVSPPLSVIANDLPDLPPVSEQQHARIRAALTTIDAEPASKRLSTPLRLSVHAMNATLIFVWAPLGAAAMTYALVEGENVKLSARLTVLAGLFAASFNSSLGQHMAAMAGV